MSRRSDVSKMLVSHQSGRAGSSVGSAVGPRRIQRVSDTSGSSVSKPVNRPTAAPTSVKNPNAKSYGFLQMKCLEVLKKSPMPMHIQELQVALGNEYAVASDREFLQKLCENPRINFDPKTKRWSFVSPYKFLTAPDSILTYLRTNRQFEINLEVLEYNKNVVNWINDLLSRHAVRAIRGTKTARCKVYSSESGLYCDLYHPDERCDGCKGLQGVIFYPLGPDYLENIELDPDIKELWHKIAPTPVAAVAALMGANKRPAGSGEQQQGRKRRKPAGARAPRIQRISNVHIYSVEEFKDALAAETPSDPC